MASRRVAVVQPLVFVLLCLFVPFHFFSTVEFVEAQLPPAGVYTVIRSDALNTWDWDFSFILAAAVNTYPNYPDISGHTDGVSYTFSGWRVTVVPFGQSFTVGTNQLDFNWRNFYFNFHFNWHVKKSIISEHGWGRVYTTNSDVDLQAPIELGLNGPTTNVAAGNVWLSFKRGDIEVYIKCDNFICLISAKDIANAVAQNFDSSFLKGVTEGINSIAQKYFDGRSTRYPISSLSNTNLWLQGNTYNMNNNLVMASVGAVLPSNVANPPFGPTSVPPASVFYSPPGQLNIIFTNYLPRTAFWTVNQKGLLNKTITNADLPPNIPFKLNTNDPIMLGIAPGLAKYPNQDMEVVTGSDRIPDIRIVPGVIDTTMIVNVGFYLANSKTFLYSVWIQVSFGTKLSAAMSGPDIQLTASFSGFNVSAGVVKTNVGTINTGTLSALLLAGIGSAFPSSLTEKIAPPTDFAVSNPGVMISQGYVVVYSAVSYTGNVPVVPCGGGYCVVGTTCCSGRCCIPSLAGEGLNDTTNSTIITSVPPVFY